MIKKKKKFKPVITRVKLNPEQAVLSCACYFTFNQFDSFSFSNTAASSCSLSFGKGSTFSNNYSFGSTLS